MKSNIIATLVVLFAATQSFASTTIYNCDLPKSSAGNVLMGGPGYQLEVGATDVVLKELVGADEGKPVQIKTIGVMAKTDLEGVLVKYQLGDVSAIFGRTFEGIWRESVSIDVLIDNETYSANCK